MNDSQEIINIENNVKPPASKFSNIIVFALLLVVIAGVAFFAYLKSQDVDIKNLSAEDIKRVFASKNSGNTAQSTAEINYDIKEKTVFASTKGYLVKCSPERIELINEEGKVEKSYQITMSKPVVKTNGSYLLVADLGGKEIYVINGKEIKWNNKAKNSIINADINEVGMVAVVEEGKGYKALVDVYDTKGSVHFTRTISESFVLSAVVLTSNKHLIVNKMDTSGISTNTVLEINDMETDKPPIASIAVENTIFPSILPSKGNTFIAVSDTVVKVYGMDGKEKWGNNSNAVISSGICMDKYLVAAITDEQKSGIFKSSKVGVNIYDLSGKLLSSYSPGENVINICVFSDKIAVNAGKEVHFINTKGKLLSKYTSNSEVTGVYFLNSQTAAVVNKSSIHLVKY